MAEESKEEFRARAAKYIFAKTSVGAVAMGLGSLAVVGALNFGPLKRPTEAVIGTLANIIEKLVPDTIDKRVNKDAYDRIATEATTNTIEAAISALVVGAALFTGLVKFGNPPIRGEVPGR